jgi:hypothetical protein
MSTTRVYKIDHTAKSRIEGEAVTQTCLVRAANPSRGLAHVVKDSITVEVCTTDYVAPEAPAKGRKGKKSGEGVGDEKQQELETAPA